MSIDCTDNTDFFVGQKLSTIIQKFYLSTDYTDNTDFFIGQQLSKIIKNYPKICIASYKNIEKNNSDYEYFIIQRFLRNKKPAGGGDADDGGNDCVRGRSTSTKVRIRIQGFSIQKDFLRTADLYRRNTDNPRRTGHHPRRQETDRMAVRGTDVPVGRSVYHAGERCGDRVDLGQRHRHYQYTRGQNIIHKSH